MSVINKKELDVIEVVIAEAFESLGSGMNTCAGYGNISQSLIQKGQVLTTKGADEYFRRGGIHNFVSCEDSKEGVDLIVLTLDMDELMKSEFLKERVQHKISEINKEYEATKDILDDLSNQMTELIKYL